MSQRTETKKRVKRVRLRRVANSGLKARYDAAQTTTENRQHWLMADDLSANAANSPEVRRRVRNRSRYEVTNNSYAKGIVLTLANDTVGTGPRLQALGEGREENQQVEDAFAAWMRATRLPEKLRLMRMARAQDGEVFGLLVDNPQVANDVHLDCQLLEADCVATPDLLLERPDAIDGIEFDAVGNPVTYHVLRLHPGSGFWPEAITAYDRIPAASVIHYYRAERPGQSRGLPEIMPALPLFAQLRRYTLAVVAAAETAADVAAVLKTQAGAYVGETQERDTFATIPIERRVITIIPPGYEIDQMEPQQPAAQYAEFKREILNEIARCLNMPYNIAACNSSSYNYASGRMDHQTYYKAIRVDQGELASVVLDRLLAAWWQEAWLLGIVSGDEVPAHQWFWDGAEHVDPLKEAQAQAVRLANATTTLAAEYGRMGRDWETELKQRALEVAMMNELGLPIPGAVTDIGPSEEAEEGFEKALRNVVIDGFGGRKDADA